MNVAILGASHKPERYSNKAMRMLAEHGHEPHLVNPRGGEIEGWPVYPDLASVGAEIDTVTVYVGPAVLDGMADGLPAFSARRYIFNPGSENPEVMERLREAGKHVVEACTLVLLSTGQFESA